MVSETFHYNMYKEHVQLRGNAYEDEWMSLSSTVTFQILIWYKKKLTYKSKLANFMTWQHIKVNN